MIFDTYNKSNLLFVIPIYFRSLDDWHKDYKRKEKQYIDEIEDNYKKIGSSMSQKERIKYEVWFNERAYLWYYNEIIGFIEIRYLYKKLYGYLIKSEAKRYSPNIRNKNYKNDFTIIPPSFDISNKSNDDIKLIIYDIISNIISKYPKFKGYYIDKEILENIIYMLNFDKLLED